MFNHRNQEVRERQTVLLNSWPVDYALSLLISVSIDYRLQKLKKNEKIKTEDDKIYQECTHSGRRWSRSTSDGLSCLRLWWIQTVWLSSSLVEEKNRELLSNDGVSPLNNTPNSHYRQSNVRLGRNLHWHNICLYNNKKVRLQYIYTS